MKSTSYILFAIIGLMVVAAFFIPLFTLRSEKPFEAQLTVSGHHEYKQLPAFEELQVINPLWITSTDSMGDVLPRVTVSADNSLASPVLAGDSTWLTNVSWRCVTDTLTSRKRLEISLDFHSLTEGHKDSGRHRQSIDLSIEPASIAAFELRVPQHMLTEIELRGVKLIMKDFTEATMMVYPGGMVEIEECSFADLKFKD